MQQLMTQAEFARHRGVSKPAVSNWKKAGHLVLQEDDAGRVKVNVERTEARLNARIDPMRGRPPVAIAAESSPALPLDQAQPGPAATAANDSLADERHAELRERRIGSALKNGQLAGDLVPLIEAERRLIESGRAARDRMQAWLRDMAERFASEREARTIMSLGEEGIDRVFAELATAASRGDFTGDEDDLTPAEIAEFEAAAEAEDEAE